MQISNILFTYIYPSKWPSKPCLPQSTLFDKCNAKSRKKACMPKHLTNFFFRSQILFRQDLLR